MYASRWVLLFVLMVPGLVGCASTPARRGAVEPTFFPPPPDAPRLQFLLAISSDADIPGARRGLTRALLGDDPLRQLVRPRGVRVHDGIIYVADAGLRTVVKIDLENKLLDWIRDEGSGKLEAPLGLDLAADGTLFVADQGRRQVLAYAAGDHRFLRAYGDPESLLPTAVLALGEKLFVSDITDHEIEIYDRHSGARVGTLGEEGGGVGQFKYPSFLAAGSDGAIYVTDTMNFRIQKLSQEGAHLMSFGKAGDFSGSVSRPKGIAVDSQGLLHVLDAGFENAQIFLPDGTAATYYGGYGDFAGSMYLPFGICLDESLLPLLRERVDPRLKVKFLVLITNQAGPHKLNIYAFGDPAAGPAD